MDLYCRHCGKPALDYGNGKDPKTRRKIGVEHKRREDGDACGRQSLNKPGDILGKPLAFPKCERLADLFDKIGPYDKDAKSTQRVHSMTLGPYCVVSDGGYRSAGVHATDAVVAFCNESMIDIDRDSLYFEIVVRDDDSALVLVKHNQILGSRWLAILPATAVRPFLPLEDR